MLHRRPSILVPALAGLATATAIMIPVLAFTDPDSPPEPPANCPPATVTVTETTTTTATTPVAPCNHPNCPPWPSLDY